MLPYSSSMRSPPTRTRHGIKWLRTWWPAVTSASRPWELPEKARSLPEPMQQAEAQLQSMLADDSLAKLHPAARHLLNYVEARLHPDQRLHEIALELSGRTPAEDFDRNLVDYEWLLKRRVDWFEVPNPVPERTRT